MSTSPAHETLIPTGEGPPSPLTEQSNAPKPNATAVEPKAPVESKLTFSEKKVPVEPSTSNSENIINESKDNIPIQKKESVESKIEPNECNFPTEKSVTSSETLDADCKLISPEEPETADLAIKEDRLENIGTSENEIAKNPEVQVLGQRPENENGANKKNKEDKNVAENDGQVNKNAVENVELKPENEKEEEQERTNPEQIHNNADTSDCVNIQELTEHVMNILNDGIANDVECENTLMKKNIDLQQFIVKLIRLLKEKTDLCANLDRQNSALISQAESLRAVIAITKDLLGIRNMEIERLHGDLTAMEETIKEEKIRHNTSVQHLNEAMLLNNKLKTEYLTQMDLFQKLRDKYNEKVVILTRENQRLNGLVNPNGPTNETPTEEVNVSDLESSQTESVDK